LISLWITADST